jgi:phosphoserine aminotransferase
MICLEDYLDALRWGKSVGGLEGLMARANANSQVLSDWVAKTGWIDFLAKDPRIRSNTSVCLRIVDPTVTSLPADVHAGFVRAMIDLLDKEGVAYDISSYRDAPAGLRIWCGATVEKADVEALTQWLDFAFETVKGSLAKAA